MVFRKNKRGSISDLIFIATVIFFFAVLVLIGFKVTNEFSSQIQSDDVFTADAKTAVASVNNLYPTAVDNSFLFLMVGLIIAAFVFAMAVAIHPVFFILYIIVFAFVIFLGAIFSNVYQQMATDPALVDMANQLIFTSHILIWLPVILCIFGFILSVVMYRTYQNAT